MSDESKKPRSGRLLTAAEGEKAVRLGIYTLTEYDDLLGEIGYRPKDRKTKIALLQAELHLKAPKKKAEEESDDDTKWDFERDAMRISEAIRG